MPQYMLLIYSPTEGGPSPEELPAEMPRWYEYTQALQDAGVHGRRRRAAAAWTPPPRCACATARPQITDGPFAETKEILGGYYIIDVPDLDAALEAAPRACRTSRYGSVEVRPVMDVRDCRGRQGRPAQA